MRQKPGQRFSEALALCRRLGDQCDVLGMTPDEIMCTRMVTLCTDDELRSELMKPEAPTVAKLTQIVQEYERSQAGKAGLGMEGAHALSASAGARQRSGGNKNQDRGEKRDKCKSCGCSHKHPRNECKFFKASCHACGETGHIKPVCNAPEDKRKAFERKKASSTHKSNSVDVPEQSLEEVCQVSQSDSKVIPYLSYWVCNSP